jgi:ketosteroid isomerase-like protein
MKHSPEIEQLMRDVVAALERSDRAYFERFTSRDPGSVSIGSDPDEYVRGHDNILALFTESTPEGPVGIRVRMREIRGYEHGDVGWADGIGAFERDGDSVEVRTTAVFVREGGHWRGVQSHASIGVPNDRMFDKVFRRPKAASGR